MSLSTPQRGVAFGMASALVLAAVGLGAALAMPGAWAEGTLEGRLHLVAFAALAPALALAFCIARLAAHRFHTPADLDGSGMTEGTRQARLLQALLQNTLEQLVLAVPVYAAWGALAPARWLGVLPVAAGMFLLGRALFFVGYARGARGRAFGFALTFYPTVLLLLGAAVFAVRVFGSP